MLSAAKKVAGGAADIVESFRKVIVFIEELTCDNATQSAGIEQISQAVAHIGEVTQSNAASTEELVTAGEHLKTQSDDLHRMVSKLSAIVSGESGEAAPRAQDHAGPGHAGRVLPVSLCCVRRHGPAT